MTSVLLIKCSERGTQRVDDVQSGSTGVILRGRLTSEGTVRSTDF
jgi:hypothetical protein